MQNMINFANSQTAINAIEAMFTIDTSVEAISNNEMSNTMISINTNDFIIDTTSDADYSIVITFEEGECEPETVMTRGGEFTMSYVENVDVSFFGRSATNMQNASGWHFVNATTGASEFLFHVQQPISKFQAAEWMKNNIFTGHIFTQVVVRSSK